MMLDPRFKLKFVEEPNKDMMREILFQEYFRFHSESHLKLKQGELERAETTDTESDSEGSFSPTASDSDGSPSKKRKLMNMDIYSSFQKSSTNYSKNPEIIEKGSKRRKRKKI